MTTRDTRDEQLSDEERLRCPICAGQRIGGRPNDGPILYVTPHAPNECRDVLRERAEKAERALAEAKFAPMGDNHHNAAACPYCSAHVKEGEDV